MTVDGSPTLEKPTAVSAGQDRVPRRRGNVGIWIGLAIAAGTLPLIFRSGTSLTMMSLMGIAIIFALSYNMLLGQTGML